MSLANYFYFIVFCIAMVFSPGPMTMLLMSISLEKGIKKTLPAQAGASSAYLISLLIFAVGLTSLLQHYAIVLKLIQYLGVSYILYLAYKQWQNSNKLEINLRYQYYSELEPKQLYYRGLITGLSNPKTIVMFSTVIPQFATNSSTRVSDLTILSMTFLVLQLLSGVTYSCFGQAIKYFLQNATYQKLLYRCMAIILILVATILARI